ncbi:M28 family peptidase [Bradyrhizobium genosp. P]|uniref:M28 family peptidase n=1 Tax=Bradyrhizobium genosp. P TaxID=83641 RepID=UPI003CEE211C
MMLQNLRFQIVFVAALLLLQPGPLRAEVNADQIKLESWDGKRALATIVDLLRFTPRAMETPGHQQAIDYIMAEVKKTKFENIMTQRWRASEAGRTMAMTNIIARFNPANPRRVIVATHYDSIIKAYRDSEHPDAPMPGANNSASGVAVLLETARVLSEMRDAPPIGIDMIFFDGEEGPISMGAGDPNFHSIGSPHFTEHLAEFYPNARPEKMLDFDMVCDRDLHLKAEQSGLHSAPAEVKKFWDIGMKIAPGAFEKQPAPYAIDDDHTAFQLAGIPSFVVIDFEYEPFYNTTEDTPDKCSVQSLEAVGRTLLKYLYVP